MASELYYMPLYQKDWLSSSTVQQMSVTAEGIYFRLCLYQWEDDGLPESQARLQRLARATDAEWESFADFVDECFPLCDDGKRRNPRVAAEREQTATKFDTLRENGRKGGRPKKSEPGEDENQKANQNETKQKPNGNQMVFESETKTKPKPNQNETISESESDTDIFTTTATARADADAGDHADRILTIGGKNPSKAVQAHARFVAYLRENTLVPPGIVALGFVIDKAKETAAKTGVDPGELLAAGFDLSIERGWKSVVTDRFPELAERLQGRPARGRPARREETLEEEARRLAGGLL